MSSSPELRSTEAPRREIGRKKEIPSADIPLSPERRQKIARDSKTRPVSLKDVYKDTKMTDSPVVSYRDLPGLLSNPNLQDLQLIARLTPEMIKTLTADIAQAKELTIPRRKQIMDELYILAENTRSHFETLKANQAQVDKYTKGIGGKIRGFFFRGAKEAALGEERVGTQALAAWEAVSKVMYLLQIGLNRTKREPLPPEVAPQPVTKRQTPKKSVVADNWSDVNAESWNEMPKTIPNKTIKPPAESKLEPVNEVSKLLSFVRGIQIWNFEAIAPHQNFVAVLKTELNGVDDLDTKIFLLARAARQELARHKKLEKQKQKPLYIRSLERLIEPGDISQKNAS